MVKIDKIKFKGKGIKFLSPLESDVLKILWKKRKAKVKDIYNILKKKRKVALTSVAVILDRLYKKRIVTRDIKKGRGGGHYIYFVPSKEDFEQSVIESVVNKLLESFGPSAVSYFNKRFSKREMNG